MCIIKSLSKPSLILYFIFYLKVQLKKKIERKLFQLHVVEKILRMSLSPLCRKTILGNIWYLHVHPLFGSKNNYFCVSIFPSVIKMMHQTCCVMFKHTHNCVLTPAILQYGTVYHRIYNDYIKPKWWITTYNFLE